MNSIRWHRLKTPANRDGPALRSRYRQAEQGIYLSETILTRPVFGRHLHLEVLSVNDDRQFRGSYTASSECHIAVTLTWLTEVSIRLSGRPIRQLGLCGGLSR